MQRVYSLLYFYCYEVINMPSVFLSPSTQEFNQYVIDGNEELYMNFLADRIEPYLRANGIRYVRNDPTKQAVGAIRDSNMGNYDVHLALHSNAAPDNLRGKLRGIDVYYAPNSRFSRNLATIMANNFESIYPLPEKSRALPTTTLGEVLRTRAVAILAEIGYHDNIEDAVWIRENLDKIAANIVMSLCDYFGIPFIDKPFFASGITVTDGYSNLNIRKYPSVSAAVIGKIPSGTTVEINGVYNDWYVVRYNNIIGYAYAPYIRVIS